MANRYLCEACEGTGQAPEARPVSLRDAIDEVADDIEAAMHMLAAKGADFSIGMGDAVHELRAEVIRMDRAINKEGDG